MTGANADTRDLLMFGNHPEIAPLNVRNVSVQNLEFLKTFMIKFKSSFTVRKQELIL